MLKARIENVAVKVSGVEEEKTVCHSVQIGVGVVGRGWVKKLRIRLNSAQLKLKLPVEAELGKNVNRDHYVLPAMPKGSACTLLGPK